MQIFLHDGGKHIAWHFFISHDGAVGFDCLQLKARNFWKTFWRLHWTFFYYARSCFLVTPFRKKVSFQYEKVEVTKSGLPCALVRLSEISTAMCTIRAVQKFDTFVSSVSFCMLFHIASVSTVQVSGTWAKLSVLAHRTWLWAYTYH